MFNIARLLNLFCDVLNLHDYIVYFVYVLIFLVRAIERSHETELLGIEATYLGKINY